MSVSPACLSALKWLRNRNGDGVFDRHQVLVASGQSAPVMRATWSRLEAAGLCEFYLNRRRLRITPAGRDVDVSKVAESS